MAEVAETKDNMQNRAKLLLGEGKFRKSKIKTNR